MQRSKSHHWVPQFYMRRWANDEDRLVSFFRGPDRNLIRTPKPRYINCEDLLYTAFLSDGTQICGEGSIFGRVDREGAEALDFVLREDWRDIPEDVAEKLYRFMYLLSARHPTVRDQFLESEGEIFEAVRKELEASGEDASEFFDDLPKAYPTARDRATLLLNVVSAFDRFTYKRLFYDSPRIFLNTHGKARLLTSDHPLTSVPSIGAEGAVHYFPLSPERGILLSRDKARLDFFKGLGFNRAVSYVNLLTVLFAHQYVYSTSRQDEETILKHLGGARRYTREHFAETLMEAVKGTVRLGL